MDICIPPKEKQKAKLVKKVIGKYFDFPCRKCGEKKVKMFVYGYIEDPNALSPREIPGGCCRLESEYGSY